MILVIERLLNLQNPLENNAPILLRIVRVIITYSLVVIAVIFFRANDFSLVPLYFKKFFFLEGGPYKVDVSSIMAYIGIAFFLQSLELLKIENIQYNKKNIFLLSFGTLLIFFLLGLYAGSGKEFVYFQF
jgi:hypothetical protein